VADSIPLFLSMICDKCLCVTILSMKGASNGTKPNDRGYETPNRAPSGAQGKASADGGGQGKKISALVRESIEEKIRELEREVFEEKMREAYVAMADENVRTAEDFKYSDAENL